MGRTVSSPDGNRWYVRRVWLPWQPKWRGRRTKPKIETDSPAADVAGCVLDLEALLFLAVVLVVLFFVWPLLVALFELLLLGVLVVLGVLVRVVLRRPWIVEATPATGSGRFRWKVVGWRRSGQVVDEVAGQLAAGRPLRVSGPPVAPE